MSTVHEPVLVEPSSRGSGVDSAELRGVLGRFATGVAIITTRDCAGNPVGLTVNSFSSVSLDPPLVLWSLRHQSASLEVFRAFDHWAVHILAADQVKLSQQFARYSSDRFRGVSHSRSAKNVPLIAGCMARLQCRTVHEYSAGDHVIFVGEVESTETEDRAAPLIFYGGRYASVRSAARLSATTPTTVPFRLV